MEAFKLVILAILRLYKGLVSPWLPPACRFWPTCSEYSYQAVSKYGVLRGGVLAVKRVCKCHPFHSGGLDPLL
ncbi:MAG TPA: membrane protein insertion efficiency factor YidD [Terriglobia bacterium]|nr:membrane protein insertion efficiency factor YidD [Terriglobia bacterium]